MTDAAYLERRYRRWLSLYPKTFRREHESEMLGVLMAGAHEGQRQPALMECLDLVRGALWMRLRPSVSQSNRPARHAIKLLCFGAVLELATTITIVATLGNVRSTIVERNPDLSAGLWHTIVTDQLAPMVVAAAIAVGFWLWTAWSIGRGHQWARIVFVLFFGLNTWSLLNGLAAGSGVYAQADLVAGLVLWLVELAAVTLLFQAKIAVALPGTGHVTSEGSSRGMGEEGQTLHRT